MTTVDVPHPLGSPDGPAREPSEDVIECIDPRTGRVTARIPVVGVAEVASAVAGARQAAGPWAEAGPRRRSAALLRVRDRILERAEDLVATICAATGKQPAEAATTELMAVCETIGYYATNAERWLRDQPVHPGSLVHKRAWKRYEPVGVVGVISPWNYPFTLAMTPVVTALAAGNTVVLKPSEVTATVGEAVRELFVDDEWPGLVTVVQGGPAVGEALVRSDVDKIAFTGSARTGRRVMAAAAERLTPVLLELGGKDPMIVRADADLDRATRGAVWGSMQNSGQTCMSVERVYVDESIHDEFVDRVVHQVEQIRQDDSGAGDIGSMTFPAQLDVVERHVADAVAKGARVLVGGRRLDRPGYWYAPTVLVGVDHTMDVMREETFGPVLPIMRTTSDDQAVELANDSRYGLNSSVWSADEDRAAELAARIEAGNVCVNDCIVSYAVTGLPFGGVKESGIGRVHGAEGLREFTNVKSVMATRFRTPREPWWFPVPAGLADLSIRTLRLRFGSTLRRRLGR